MTADRVTLEPAIQALLVDLGVSVANVLRRAALPGDLFVRGPVSLRPEEYFALWQALEAEADDPVLPITMARTISVEVFDPSIFAALCSPNLTMAAQRIAKYKRLISPMRVAVSAESMTAIELQWPEHLDPPPGLALAELLFWVALARLGTRTNIRPVRVQTPVPPEDPDAYGEFLGVPVERGTARVISFSAHDAALPFLTADERIWQFFEPELRRRLSELEATSSTADRVRASLLERLPAGTGSMSAVAGELAVSTRSLQRKLRAEGTTFQAILSETREALARHYLRHPNLGAGDIAFLLGYEDPSSFYRAFHAWTGETPERVRAGAA